MSHKKLLTIDEQIALAVKLSLDEGELQTAKSWGKPLEFGDGYDETPAELQMPYKILKDSGFVPPEVQMLKDLEQMRIELSCLNPMSQEAADLREQISYLQLNVTMRIENLR